MKNIQIRALKFPVPIKQIGPDTVEFEVEIKPLKRPDEEFELMAAAAVGEEMAEYMIDKLMDRLADQSLFRQLKLR